MYNVQEILDAPALRQRLFDAVADPRGQDCWPRSAKIKLTTRCNLKCVMCRYWRLPPGPELDAAAAIALVRDLARLGCRKVHFSGGEVLARPDFLDILDAASEFGLKLNFTTNATLVTKEVAKRLARARVNSVAVSFDAGQAKGHDRIRGVPGAFKRAAKGAALIVEHARSGTPKLRINTVLTRHNYHELPSVIRLAHQLGAVEVHPMPVDAKNAANLRLAKQHIRDFNTNVAPDAEALRAEYGFSTDDAYVHPFGTSKGDVNLCRDGLYARGYFDERLCYAPWLHTFVEWTGDVYLCCMTRRKTRPLGNALATPIADILCSEPYARARRALKRRRLVTCAHCDNYLAENRLIHAALEQQQG